MTSRLPESRQNHEPSTSSPLTERPRRLRRTRALRALVRETSLRPDQLILPLFVHESPGEAEISSMPGVWRQDVTRAVERAAHGQELGVSSVVLFGIPSEKDELGSGAYSEEGVVQRAARELKRQLPELTVIFDTCLCEYTSHGHCGPLHLHGPGGATVDNDAALALIARTAVSQARAGADVIAPSAAMDGMVGAIRSALDANGFHDTAIMSYAVKYASAFYGPFRDAADSAPAMGDRASYQMDPLGGYREALREARLDVAQGADFLMVKPALAYLDVLRSVREHFDLPLVAYNVSGEYAMVKMAARAGILDERRVVLESLGGMRRAGADAIITYHALDAARWLREA
ncbi:porphobilinogen synthase [Deinococcus peraridilitoris]|uniref:Delta-aminolevulinic acid dehydratase n=1 Tax=Deinococcus peraridilitoris (strain DSM 19664 / LMG 22246 / CIP 109416 / KR-200) TaxID=937777 RepID=L0A4W4_DEIPD|nr:porphobilinogen synthase [Deinococcus peraridilitoris]AFZ68901.1 delta-aminolevulinic acid dehydratase [Deinococcus peraridilitoris DSM 19664]